MSIVYMAGAIDLVDGDNRTSWRDEATAVFNDEGIAVYNPVGAFGAVLNNKKVAESIVAINAAALDECDHIIFVMGKDYPSVGTPIELFMAHQKDLKYTVVWNPIIGRGHGTYKDNEDLPIYIRHFAGPRAIFKSIDDAIGSILIALDGDRPRMPAPPFMPPMPR